MPSARVKYFRLFLWIVVPLLLIVVLYRVGHRTKKQYTVAHLVDKTAILPIAIIGGGPAGLTAAMYGSRAGFYTAVFQGFEPGGQLTETQFIENWPGVPKELGPDVMARVEKQAQGFGVILVPKSIESVDLSSWPFKLKVDDGSEVYALTVIVATGATPRKLGIPGENEYWGKGVISCPKCDAPFTKGKHVLIAGAGDTAAEFALQVAPYASKITIAVRSEAARASAFMQKKLDDYKHINMLYNKKLGAIHGDGTSITHVDLIDTKDGTTSKFDIEWVLIAIGFDPNTSLIKGQLALDPRGTIKIGCHNQHTSVEGVYAAGNVSDPTYRQAVTVSGDGARAGLDAVKFLFSLDNRVINMAKSKLYQPKNEEESSE